MPEWIDRPLPEISEALRKGRLTARDLTDEAIARHDKWDLQLGAYKTWDPEYARRQAAASDAAFTANKDLGLAQGIPFSVKDIYGAEGFPIYAGSPKRLPPEWEKNGPVLNKVRQQLAVIPGKTHTVEFAFGGIVQMPIGMSPVIPGMPRTIEHQEDLAVVTVLVFGKVPPRSHLELIPVDQFVYQLQ